MALPTFNTKSPTIKRILKEATELSTHPDPTLHAAPLESNLFEWHFTLSGPPGTPYSEGAYHGRIILPSTYPLRPPMFRFLTPSGRFEVNREICLSISGHHEETWQPAWGIRTALWALRAFMEGDAKGQVGGMEMPEKERRRLAVESRAWRCQGCGGRSNEDILREEGGDANEAKQSEVIVPEGLRFGFKDEMVKAAEQETTQGTSKHPEPVTTAASASTATSAPPETSQPTPASSSVSSPLPTRTLIVPSTVAVPQPVAAPVRQTQSDGVPPWIDKAITGLAAALAVMVIKKILL
ncbi:ubiquitin-conjugating enzyme E2 J1, partial [Lecanoromycetidae sp. Uapishka_2]